MSNSKTVRLMISGRVQGVGYRAWTKANARKRKLNGWVRNRSDGTVEAVFSGAADMVDEMIAECKNGPLACRVLGLDVHPHAEAVAAGFDLLESV